MIPGTELLRQVPDWQTALGQVITDPAELLDVLGLGPEWLSAARGAARAFPLRVPRAFVARMRRGDPADPLLRQVLPLAQESHVVEGFSPDPVGDLAAHMVPGVLHKYEGRVLLTATGACAIHCRYCFRRHFPYAEANASTEQWRAALDYVTAHPDIREVILSGGDPLTLSDRRLTEFIRALEGCAHVERLRLHTRLPVVLPERVTQEFCTWLSATRFKTVVVIHANHAQELDDTVRVACQRIADSGVTLLNQSVLLRGVNDSVAALTQLSEALFAAGVLPYYLHLLDCVQGAAHFDVSVSTARQLMVGLNARLPGYLVPRLVREVPGAPSKELIA
jgi:EF-P beta-lysylation protein EpmB